MATFYVLFDPHQRMFAESGYYGGMCYSMNFAKLFTSQWSAENYKKRSSLYECCIVKKIVIG